MRLLYDTIAASLGAHVAQILGIQPVERTVRCFPDGEVYAEIKASVEKEDVFVLCSTPADAWMPLFMLLDALMQARPNRIYLCFAYFGYGRQDRPTMLSGCFSVARLAAMLGTFPLEKIFIIDLHNCKNTSLFLTPCFCVSSYKIFSKYIEQNTSVPDLFIAPDRGASHRVKKLAEACARPWSVLDKRASFTVDTSFRDTIQRKRCALVDDLVDSGRTLCNAMQMLWKCGAQSAMLFVTHGLFKGGECPFLKEARVNASETWMGSFFEELVVTDTLPLPLCVPSVKQVTIAPLVAELFKKLCQGQSIEDLLV
ncbi:MAG: ribose-phosphate diphosphokinase [Holosporales bacterium]|jgi:ribose-phosphate pyrophosphokinase|nr:ribose-phosphate diphosphokinase [Holosporales bacterium]